MKKKYEIIETPGNVLFPGAIMRSDSTTLYSSSNLTAEEDRNSRVVVVPTNKDGSYPVQVGVLARTIKVRSTTWYEGLHRVKLLDKGAVKSMADLEAVMIDKQAVAKQLDVLKGEVKTLLDLSGTDGTKVVKELSKTAEQAAQSPSKMMDILASVLPFDFKEKIKLLEEPDLLKRLGLAIPMITAKTAVLEKAVAKFTNGSSTSSSSAIRLPGKNLDKKSREKILKSQLKSIKKELNDMGSSVAGEQDAEDDEDGLKELRRKIEALPLGEDSQRVVMREMKRLERMHPSQAEYNVTRTYLETLCDIPWTDSSKQGSEGNELTLQNVTTARRILDEQHYGLEKVKKRLVEYLTVMYLRQQSGVGQAAGSNNDDKAPVLLLVGPPGVGKTSLAKSVASALSRKLHRISLGGLRDEAELKGHRRTYVGAMPGELAKAMIKTGVTNPVIVLDEIDKLAGPTQYGDPTGVMLEVLDPESNRDYFDRYVSIPIDLSKVLFIATANNLDTISPPLLDRMETIHIDGYTYREKEAIATRYLIPKQERAAGLEPGSLAIKPEVVRKIATEYTREAGVRSLERSVGTLCRAKAVERVQELNWNCVVEVEDVEKYLGLPRYDAEAVSDVVDEYEIDGVVHRRTSPGVVNGLAFMGSGNGGILKFEATSMRPGKGNLKLTGKLGDVISESAQLALSWVKANCTRFGIDSQSLSELDIHLHAPAGAIPKDGPSAGVAMTIALVSLLTDRVVPGEIAMTGEMTLRGKVLPVGGIREKLLGAHLAGVKKVLVPYSCRKVVLEDCADLLKEESLQVVYVKYIFDALKEIWPTERLILDSRI